MANWRCVVAGALLLAGCRVRVDVQIRGDSAFCACQEADVLTVALYSMDDLAEGLVFGEASGEHPDGRVVGSILPRLGDATCGRALGIGRDSWGEIPHHVAWHDLKAIDFWLWLPPPRLPKLGAVGVISRDATGTSVSGHLTLHYTETGVLRLRVQGLDGEEAVQLCTAGPVATEQWVHVGINLGAPMVELIVDGEVADFVGETELGGIFTACGLSTERTMNGNQNPWLVGASAINSREGEATPTEDSQLIDGRVDQLRFSSERRDFSGCRG